MFQDIEWMDLNFLERTQDSQKGEYGRVSVVGGSSKYPSTPAIVGLGALRTGVDLLEIVSEKTVLKTCSYHNREFIFNPLQEKNLDKSLERIRDSVNDADCAVLGNGVPKDSKFQKNLLKVIERVETPMVIDAGLLTQELKDIDFSGKKVVLTPHKKEFERLYEEPEKEIAVLKEQVKKAARVYDATILLKGRFDVISDGESVFVNRTGTPYLSKGGTGDILAGIVSVMLPRTREVKAGFLACYLNGKAGEKAFEKHGPGFDLEELGEQISLELKKLL